MSNEELDEIDQMKAHYDFSKGERGKFYRPNARVHLPIFIEGDVLTAFSAIAERKGVDLGELVNDTLKRELKAAEALR